jgi:hypothetical protein
MNLELIINDDSWIVQILLDTKKYYIVDPTNKKLYIAKLDVNQVKYDVWLNYHEPYKENYYE